MEILIILANKKNNIAKFMVFKNKTKNRKFHENCLTINTNTFFKIHRDNQKNNKISIKKSRYIMDR